MQQMSARENPLATIAILCPYIFFAEAFRSILEHLPDAELVPDYTAIPAGKHYPQEAKEAFRDYLSKTGLPWRDIELTGLTPAEFFLKYGTVAAPFYGGWSQHAATGNHRKARIFYGGAKDLWCFALWNIFFDRIFTPGDYFSQVLNDLYGAYGTRASTTGEPQLDGLTEIGSSSAKEKLSVNSGKPVVLFALTWGALSSFGRVIPALTALTEEYEVICKVHHMQEIYEPESLAVLRGTSVRLVGQDTSLATALCAADVVISDSSGAIFDALLADKPLVLLDTIGEGDDAFFAETPFYGTAQGRLAGVSTSRVSLEQIVKRGSQRVGPVVPLSGPIPPGGLMSAISEARRSPDRFALARKEALARFAPVDGKASMRIAQGIAELSRVPFDSVGQRQESLLSRLVRDLQERMYENSRSKTRMIQSAAEHKMLYLEHVKRMPIMKKLSALFNEFFV